MLPTNPSPIRMLPILATAAALCSGPAAPADPWDSGPSNTPSQPTKPARPGVGTADAKPTPAMKETAKALFATDTAAAANQWTIALVAFRGDQAEEAGRLGLDRVRSVGGLPGAFLERRGDAVVICVGRFESPTSPQAAQELKRIQAMEVDGKRPYADAVLSPPLNSTNLGAMPQFNLLQAKAMFGDEALYTLQVAVYGRRDLLRPTEEDLAEARKAAEIAVVRLRQEGEQAFYYHGPRMSMVTIGVFTLEDFDPQTPSYKSSRLLEAQRRHPYNLYNGAGIRELGRNERLQPSNLVAIPSK